MARRSFVVELRRDGTVLTSVRTGSGDAEMLVGRSHACSLRVPDDEMSVSGKHATLSWKGGHLYIADANSRNGVFIRGERLTKPRRVKAGEIYAIGNCSLSISEASRNSSAAARPHQLEWLNGENVGKTVAIVPRPGEESFTIGLDPGSCLALPDMLVSRHHAEMTTREGGECWIRDLGSRNGTYINGEVLRGKERLLKNNDKISIAYFDFRFLDGKYRHARFHVWVKLFALAATLSIAGLVFVMHGILGNSVDDCLKLCSQMAAEERFDEAKLALDEAKMARDADKAALRIGALEVSIERWKRTASEWRSVQRELAAGRLERARGMLDPLVSLPLDAWTWNSLDAIENRKTAEFAAELLAWDYSCDDVLSATASGRPEEQADAIAQKERPLREFLQRERERIDAVPCFSNLSARLAAQLGRLGGIRGGFAAVDDAIAKIDDNSPDFRALTATLERIEKDKSVYEAVRSYASKYKLPCAELAEARAFVLQEGQDLVALRFSLIETNRTSFSLPQKALCARHPSLSMHRAKIEHQHERVMSLVRSVSSLVDGLASRGVENGSCDTALQRVLTADSWLKALSFDCLEGRPPKARRKDPCGFYDELLGVEFTYQSLRALPGAYNGFALRMTGFTPNIVDAKRTLEQVDQFVTFIDNGPAMLRKGALGEFRDYGRRLLADRDAIVASLSAYGGTPRAKLVAGFYADYLSGGGTLPHRKQLAEEFKSIQKEVSDLAERYTASSDPVEQISLRTKIMAVGLPGDAQLHSKWVQKYEGRANQ